MNRKQARTAMRGKAKGPNLNDPRQAQAMLENLPIATLVAGINNSLDILQKRGIPISDWDQKKRELYRLKVFGDKVYFLADELDRSEQKTNKEDEADGSEKQAAEKRTERGQGNA